MRPLSFHAQMIIARAIITCWSASMILSLLLWPVWVSAPSNADGYVDHWIPITALWLSLGGAFVFPVVVLPIGRIIPGSLRHESITVETFWGRRTMPFPVKHCWWTWTGMIGWMMPFYGIVRKNALSQSIIIMINGFQWMIAETDEADQDECYRFGQMVREISLGRSPRRRITRPSVEDCHPQWWLIFVWLMAIFMTFLVGIAIMAIIVGLMGFMRQ